MCFSPFFEYSELERIFWYLSNSSRKNYLSSKQTLIDLGYIIYKTFNILLLGSSGTGKTALFNYLVYKKFDALSERKNNDLEFIRSVTIGNKIVNLIDPPECKWLKNLMNSVYYADQFILVVSTAYADNDGYILTRFEKMLAYFVRY